MVLQTSSDQNKTLDKCFTTSQESDCSSANESPVISSTALMPYSYQRLIDRINQRIASKDRFFSLEFFPPRTNNGAVNLLARLERMSQGNPLFCDITWHSAGNPGSDCETSSITIASSALNYCGIETMLHMTCCNMSVNEVGQHLRRARDQGLKNILALRGDRMESKEWRSAGNEFSYAVDLVRYIKQTFGDYFVIGVAGYPTGHPDCPVYEDELIHLKEKVDAGADFIVTQLFFKAETFFKYVEDCRRIGITVPIIPGVMPIQNYESLRNIVKLAKMDIPREIMEIVQPLKDNDEAIRNFGISHAVDMISTLLADERVPGIHFFTLNREFATVSVLRRVGLWCEDPHRPLPWKLGANPKRCTEDVRPIFWSSRPKSYIYRTQNWDEFPNGRWGSSESPALGDIKDYYMFFIASKSSRQELVKMWGSELKSEQDIWDVFCRYISGEPNQEGVQVTKTPWNDDELSKETALLKIQLIDVNKRGVLTINSQPRANAVPSSDHILGWGYPGGYVYQKGNEDFTNCHKHAPIAVTWGVFPGREIIQPTVVDPVSFKVWKDEAFELWLKQWGKLYSTDSPSHKLLEDISESYYLVNLVDNDFVQESCLWEVMDAMFNQRDMASIVVDKTK